MLSRNKQTVSSELQGVIWGNRHHSFIQVNSVVLEYCHTRYYHLSDSGTHHHKSCILAKKVVQVLGLVQQFLTVNNHKFNQLLPCCCLRFSTMPQELTKTLDCMTHDKGNSSF